ncbi:MAG: hypothetical protein KGL39_44910 [Patescibacteria group bacterium]|nr:hypothetical protein [Patescibacteria group bacterium]
MTIDLSALKIAAEKAANPDYQNEMQHLRGAFEMQEICDALVTAVARLEAAERVVEAAREMRKATEAYVIEAEREPGSDDARREAAIREARATAALDGLLGFLQANPWVDNNIPG